MLPAACTSRKRPVNDPNHRQLAFRLVDPLFFALCALACDRSLSVAHAGSHAKAQRRKIRTTRPSHNHPDQQQQVSLLFDPLFLRLCALA